jgi:hypothetical protein
MFVGAVGSVDVGTVVGLVVAVTVGSFVDVCSEIAVAVLPDPVVELLHAPRSRIAKPIAIVRTVGFLWFTVRSPRVSTIQVRLDHLYDFTQGFENPPLVGSRCL